MADSREPPPLNESNFKDNDEDNDDLFVSAVQTQPISKPKSDSQWSDSIVDNLLPGGGVEVSLDDDPVIPVDKSQSKLQFHTPDSEIEGSTFGGEVTNTAASKESSQSAEPPSKPVIVNPVPSAPKKVIKPSDEFEEDKDQFIEVSVLDPEKVGDGIGAYVVYKVATRTNLPYFRKKSFSVNRRFSDFLGLHSKLVEKHLHLGRIVPPAPEKSVLGMTKIKMSKDESAVSQGDFVEKRRLALERYLNRTAAHPVLRVDPDFREFLELEMELPKATNTSALSGASVLRLFNRMGDTVNKITFKMDESDPWFEEKQHQIENLDQQLRKLHASVESLIFHRKDLSVSTGSFAKCTAMLGNCEEHTSLSRALSQLAEVEDKVEQLYSNQANNDYVLLAEMLKDYICLIGAVKDVFHQRVKVYQTWQHAQQVLTKKREQKAKLELSGKTDKLQQARAEVVEWEAKVERGQEEFENISKMIHKEVECFEKARVKDFKTTIMKYMETLLDTQQQLIKCWEAFLPEAKAIV